MMQIFDKEEIPPPMPSSCRPLGSGEPITCRKMGSQSLGFSGRSSLRNITALEVPPRMNTAGSRAFAIGFPYVFTLAVQRRGHGVLGFAPFEQPANAFLDGNFGYPPQHFLDLGPAEIELLGNARSHA